MYSDIMIRSKYFSIFIFLVLSIAYYFVFLIDFSLDNHFKYVSMIILSDKASILNNVLMFLVTTVYSLSSA